MYIYIYMYTHMCVYIYIYAYVYAYVYVFIYIVRTLLHTQVDFRTPGIRPKRRHRARITPRHVTSDRVSAYPTLVYPTLSYPTSCPRQRLSGPWSTAQGLLRKATPPRGARRWGAPSGPGLPGSGAPRRRNPAVAVEGVQR